MNLASVRLAKHLPWLVAMVLVAGTESIRAGEASSAVYRGLKRDEFMKRWLVLSPIAVGQEGEPDEGAQKKAFATDLLKPAGGEVGVAPAAGQTASIDGK